MKKKRFQILEINDDDSKNSYLIIVGYDAFECMDSSEG